ncbi:MAG: PEP-CTERM sorting domain-containing protein, partial [Halieaceae bacterium]|nr:PEP-CTERM sorting domain-containing protein [Halieaceae bacterium]
DRVLRGAALALAAMLLCVAFSAEARLIRNGGRATVSNNSAKYVLLVDDTRISGDFLILDDSSRPDQDGSANLATMESGSERIYTVPDECFTFVGSFAQQEEFNATNEDCRYEFLEGEPLEFLGFMDHFLPGAFVDIQWSLTSPDSAFSFDFPGEITSFDTESDFTSTTAVLNLSVDAPPGLVPGEYEIAARSIQTAPAGFSFFEYAFVTPTACDVPIFGPDGPTVCLLGGESFGDTYSNSSLGTQVTILPGDAPPVLTVPAPSTLSLLVASFGAAIGFRRRRRVPEQGQRLRLLRA